MPEPKANPNNRKTAMSGNITNKGLRSELKFILPHPRIRK